TENGDSADAIRSYAEAHSVDAAGALSVDQQRAERAAGMGEVYVPEEDAGYAPVYGTEDDTSEDDVLYEDAGTVSQGNDYSDPEDDAGSFEYTYE
ncbi:hypothetical protein, partial [Faecalibaculum rodentium]|uniref:hypothetical protein n=1 Tax=Faecalibaculum rodentium TaxID=1702221 RepID=UPI0026237063